jgi:hypothetical protein
LYVVSLPGNCENVNSREGLASTTLDDEEAEDTCSTRAGTGGFGMSGISTFGVS